jgi:hypothetical protein
MRFWSGTHRRGAALRPVTPLGEGDELDSAWSRDWPADAAWGKLRHDGQDGRASEGKEKRCAARSAAEMEGEGRCQDSAVTGEGLGAAAPCGAAEGPVRARLGAEQGGSSAT